ncbi:hypothetical protein AGMMS50276_00750 [Synergistales bacterium]|nr:hypothetical protein AGMMS50276_00750 [Synergistales bacterium]
MKKDQDLWSGAVIILFALFLISQMKKLSFMQSVYPMTLAVLMIMAGIGILLRALITFKRTGKSYHALSLRDLVLQAVIPGSFVIVMCLLLRNLGFYIDVFIVMAGICVLQDFVIKGKLSISPKLAAKILAFSASCSVGLYISFNILLKLSTPAGFLGF